MASNPNYCDITPEIMALAQLAQQNSSIDPDDYVRYDVKRGLRDLNGKGVLAGLTEISDIVAKKMVNGELIRLKWKTARKFPATESSITGELM